MKKDIVRLHAKHLSTSHIAGHLKTTCKYRLVLLYDGEVNFPRSDFPLEGKRPLLKKPIEFKSQ